MTDARRAAAALGAPAPQQLPLRSVLECRLSQLAARLTGLRRFVPRRSQPLFDELIFNARVQGLPDRLYLENRILPALAQLRLRRILFVGVAWFTKRYARAFENSSTEYWTLDIDAQESEHGNGEQHVVGDVTQLQRYFEPRSFDAIILNGVLGFGVDDLKMMNAAIDSCGLALRTEGILVVGWNPDRISDPLELESIRRAFSADCVLELPRRARIDSFDTHQHVYDFFTHRPPVPQRSP